MLSKEQSLEKQSNQHPYIKPTVADQITMVIPGRRALGEQWVKVTLGHDGEDMVYDRVAADAPADGKPIIALTGEDAEYAKYILQAQMDKAKARAVAPQELTHEERMKAVNEAWQAYMGDKLAWLKGRSTIGAGGLVQRNKVVQNPADKPAFRKE